MVIRTELKRAKWAADRSRVDPSLGEVALVSMPFGTMLAPSIALGQIQAQLLEAGQPAFSLYLNVEFAKHFGPLAYEMIAKRRGVDVQIGEWLFAAAAWDEPAQLSEAEFCALAARETETLREIWEDPVGVILDFRNRVVPAFLDQCAENICARPNLRVVGFSCMFYQTLASIALARRIKQRRPELKVVFGGPSVHDDMGRQYFEALPWLDAICIGEADRTATRLFRALAAGEAPAGLGDILWRDEAGGAVHEGGPSELADAASLDAVPAPEYENYFRAMDRAGFLADASVVDRIYIPYETSRGCWWGQKKHCTFCGLNALGMSYRSKSPARALELIEGSFERWGVPRLMAVDNILPQNYYDTVLPALRDGPYASQIELLYEIKTNVAREKIKLLADSGVRQIIPGIESLSTNVLRCIDKGVTAIHNVFALKLFSQYGITPGWGLLIRVPGEQAADYAGMAELIPKLMHLQPPFGGPRPVEMHRFSPYYFQADRYVESYEPQAWYNGLFPKGAVDLRRVAYYFDAEWRDVPADEARAPVVSAVWRWVAAWRERRHPPKLTWTTGSSGAMEIFDSRGENTGTWLLDAQEAAVYRLMDDPLPRTRLAREAERIGIAPQRVEAMLAAFLAQDLVIELDDKLLALAVADSGSERSLEDRRKSLSRPGQREQLKEAGFGPALPGHAHAFV